MEFVGITHPELHKIEVLLVEESVQVLKADESCEGGRDHTAWLYALDCNARSISSSSAPKMAPIIASI